MKEKIKKVYYCDFCKKKTLTKNSMVSHEITCLHNPKNIRPCLSCNHLDRAKIEYDSGICDYNTYEPVYKQSNGFRCVKLDKLLIHPKARFSDALGDIDYVTYNGKYEVEQFDMPKECEHHNTVFSL